MTSYKGRGWAPIGEHREIPWHERVGVLRVMIYCSAVTVQVPAHRWPNGRWRCSGCGQAVRIVG